MDYSRFYELLFRDLQAELGPLDEETLTSIVGFSAGGPVSMRTAAAGDVCVTCELAAYPEQQVSAEGLRFELLSTADFPVEWCRSVFTALGALSMRESVGDGHTVDVSGVVENDPWTRVRLELYSTVTFEGARYGVYRVAPA